MQTPNCFSQSLPKIMFLFICGTIKNSCSCFFLPISYFSNAHPSTSIESPFTDCNKALHFFNLGLSPKKLYILECTSDTSAPESSSARYFWLSILIIHEFGLPASSIFVYRHIFLIFLIQHALPIGFIMG